MSISEMHIAFNLELDKVNSLQYPSFTDNERDYFLNQSIRKFVKTRYSGVNAKREGFEQTQKRIDDLRTLVREVTVVCIAGTTGVHKPNSYVLTGTGFSGAAFATDAYWLSLGEEVQITPTAGVAIRQGVTEVTSDEYRFEIDNPYSSFRLHYGCAKPLRLFYNNTSEFISDGGYVVNNAYIRYIKAPATVVLATTSCDLPEHTHDEIVALAVQMALENIEQPRLQSYSQDVVTME
jgi:hypothetical protein